MNWITKHIFKVVPKTGYTIIWETIDEMKQEVREEIIRQLVKAYLPGKHIQGSHKGKKKLAGLKSSTVNGVAFVDWEYKPIYKDKVISAFVDGAKGGKTKQPMRSKT